MHGDTFQATVFISGISIGYMVSLSIGKMIGYLISLSYDFTKLYNITVEDLFILACFLFCNEKSKH